MLKLHMRKSVRFEHLESLQFERVEEPRKPIIFKSQSATKMKMFRGDEVAYSQRKFPTPMQDASQVSTPEKIIAPRLNLHEKLK